MAILSSGDITVICEPTGPSMEDAERVQGALAKNDQFLAAIGGTNYRILEVSFPEAEGKARARRPAATERTPLMFPTCTGVFRCVAVPSPSWP